jgi:ribose transport system ATP-binding protein
MTTSIPMLAVRQLSKRFGVTRVLSDVDLEIGRNQVIGLVGENGAGKSTLLNILSGIVQPDRGEIVLAGRPIRPANYAEAAALGIARVFQEQALIPNIRVYENLLLSHEGRFTRFGQILRRSAMVKLAQSLLAEAGLELDVTRTTSDYSFSKRQLIEIVRACLVPIRLLGVEHPVVLLDEPTASLEKGDEEIFFRLLDRMRTQASFIFVSHRLTEVMAVSDAICVLKDGRVVARLSPQEADEKRLHGLMVGRDRDADYYREQEQGGGAGAPVYEVRGLTQAGLYHDVSVSVAAGEILGIGGLLESGKSEFGKGAAGVIPPDQGEVRLAGGGWEPPDIRNLVAKGAGYVPAERMAEGLIADFPVAWNMSLASGADLFSNRLGIWRGSEETKMSARMSRRLSIRGGEPGRPCRMLSGGNQQKVVLARWLCRPIRVLVLDNPTRGVDAGGKEEIYGIIRQLTAAGVAIILITDELLELIGLSDRIAIMQHGRVAATVDASPRVKPTELDLIKLMLAPSAPVQPARAA